VIHETTPTGSSSRAIIPKVFFVLDVGAGVEAGGGLVEDAGGCPSTKLPVDGSRVGLIPGVAVVVVGVASGLEGEGSKVGLPGVVVAVGEVSGLETEGPTEY
jgi:hypothetical protein